MSTEHKTKHTQNMETLQVKLAWLELPEKFDHNDLIRQSIARAYRRGCRFSFFVHCVGCGYAETLEGAERKARAMARRACPTNPPYWEVSEMVLSEVSMERGDA